MSEKTTYHFVNVVDWDEEGDTIPQVTMCEEDWYETEDTSPYMVGFQPVVDILLHLGSSVDPRQDQPYMPYPRTCMTEAIAFLGRNGKVGIQGGFLYYQEEQESFSCSQVGGRPTPITLAELRTLLRTNYHNGV